MLEPGASASRRSHRRFWGGVTIICAVIGAFLISDAVLAVTWQEPISALYANAQRHRLERNLARADVAGSLPSVHGRRSRARGRRINNLLARAAQRLAGGTSAGGSLGRIAIPRMHADFVFVAGTDPNSLREGPGHYLQTALPGQPGTVGLAGHRTTYLAPFRHLDDLRPGDRIVLAMPYGRFIYVVRGTRITTPENTSVLARIRQPQLVLTACHPLFSAAERIVVTARLKTTIPRFKPRRT